MDGERYSLREVDVEGGDAETNDECGADKCGTGVWKERADVSEREISEEQLDEGRKRTCAETGNDGDVFGRREILE